MTVKTMSKSKDGRRLSQGWADTKGAVWCAIRDAVNPDRWMREEWVEYLRQDGSRIVLAFDQKRTVLGGIAYQIHPQQFVVDRLIVCHALRRRRIGSFLIDAIKRKIHRGSQERFIVQVPDWNTRAHLFLQSCGLMARMIRARENDIYEFQWTIEMKENEHLCTEGED